MSATVPPHPEKSKRLSGIQAAASMLSGGDRARFLDSVCPTPEERNEINLLLSGNEPTAVELPQKNRLLRTNLPDGSQFGRYRIESTLGEGGAGRVYLAHDAALNRKAAIKVLHDSGDTAARGRFLREARSASALNHPNIVTVYEVGVVEGVDFIAMEHLSGKPLKDLIPEGKGLDLAHFFTWAGQIADALHYAHAHGIVHRDLKPGNVMITDRGMAKVVDFGLAKRGDGTTNQGAREDLTNEGAIVGTPAFMAPEQALGKPVDSRADIFSFGCVLYHMISGQRPFRADTMVGTLLEVVQNDPVPLSRIVAGVPAPLEHLISVCLRKEREERWQSAGDIRVVLDQIQAQLRLPITATPDLSRPRWREWLISSRTGALLAVAAGGLVLAALTGLFTGTFLGPGTAFVNPAGFRYIPFAREQMPERNPAWSADGKTLVYQGMVNGVNQIFKRSLQSTVSSQLTRGMQNCQMPQWSPDASTIYYWADGGVWAVGASGGTPRRVLANADGASVAPDGKSVAFFRASKLWVGTLAGDAREYPGVPSNPLVIHYSPDGARIAMLVSPAPASGQTELWLVPATPASGKPGKVATLGNIAGISWFPDNRRMIVEIMQGPQDVDFHILDTLTGKTTLFLNHPDILSGSAISPDGKSLAFYTGPINWDLWEIGTEDAAVKPLLARGGADMSPDWAPGGGHYLFATDVAGRYEIWDRAVQDGFMRVLVTGDSLPGASPHTTQVAQGKWAPDGEQIVFLSQLQSSMQIGIFPKLWLQNAAGGRPVPLDQNATLSQAAAWSPDGQWIAYRRFAEGKLTIAKIQPGAGSPPVSLAEVELGELSNEIRSSSFLTFTEWAGDWILYKTRGGLHLMKPDGSANHLLTDRPAESAALSRDGRLVYALMRDVTGGGLQWLFVTYDANSGVQKRSVPLRLPVTVSIVNGMSVNPDGRSVAISSAQWDFDIWLLEGFNQPRRSFSGLTR